MERAEHRYEILATLGKGGFGTVYRARFTGEGGFTKQVAIKVLNANLQGMESLAQRLRDEARMLGMLDHRAIVRVDRLVQVEDRWAFVMEYVNGVDLRILMGAGPIKSQHTMEIVGEVASALHAAFDGTGHGDKSLGLVHRDIKPENILLTPAGDVKVLDFGIARAEFDKREAFTTDISFGSPNYMAPERFDQSIDEPDHSSTDIYSLGLVLYELVLGRPFGRTSPIESRHARFVQERIELLRHANVTPGILELTREMLAYDPEKRPAPRDVERRCLELKAEMSSEPLRFWAERTVPALIRDETDVPMDIARIMREDATAVYNVGSETILLGGRRPTEHDGLISAGLRGASAIAALLLLAVVGGGAAGSIFFWLSDGQTPTPAPSTPLVMPTPLTASPELAEPSTQPKEEVAAPIVPAKTIPEPVEAPAAPVAVPTPVQPASAQTAPELSAEEPHGVVQVVGDADQVVLVGVLNRYAVPGRVPPGRYSIAAAFGGGPLHGAAAVEVTDGQILTIRCDDLLEICVIH